MLTVWGKAFRPRTWDGEGEVRRWERIGEGDRGKKRGEGEWMVGWMNEWMNTGTILGCNVWYLLNENYDVLISRK